MRETQMDSQQYLITKMTYKISAYSNYHHVPLMLIRQTLNIHMGQI